MLSRKSVVYFILMVLPVISAAQQSQTQFNGKNALAAIEALCRPEFQGRKTGLPGARKAALWIADEFKRYGLYPGDDDRYLQIFPMISTDQQKVTRFHLKNGLFGDVTYQEGNDFNLYFNSGSGKVRGEVIFAGFGISEPEKGRDDYSGIDVKGKIVLIYRGRPADGQDWSAENERDYKMQKAAVQGAAALLILEAREWSIRGGTIHEEGYFAGIPSLSISRKVARDIFQGTYKNMDSVIRDLAKSSQSFSTGKEVLLDVRMKRMMPGEGENVIGIVPGTHPQLKYEYIIVGGHMDHNGVSPDGHAYVGADDNASGTAVVMELARAIAVIPGGLKRSVVFIGFGGEEQGLCGSRYFAYHPTVPANKIAAMLNFYREGTGGGGGGFGGRNYFPGTVRKVHEALCDSASRLLRMSRGWGMGGSDHAHFIEQGIPAFGFFSTGGHPFYHRVEDKPHTINIASLQFVGDRAMELITSLANRPKSLLFNGQRTGRTFRLFGDQIDIYSARHHPADLKKSFKTLAANHVKRGIRGVIFSIDAELAEKGPENLYKSADRLNEWLSRNSEAIRYRNGSSLNQAGSASKIAVALGLNGTAVLNDDAAKFRILARLGVNFLFLHNDKDPFFNAGELSSFGEKILKICAAEGVVIHWSLDSLSAGEALSQYKGPVILEKYCSGKEDILLLATDALVSDGNRLLVLTCSPGTDKGGLVQLAASLENHALHLNVSGETDPAGYLISREEPGWENALIQAIYEANLQQSDRKRAYGTMNRLLGGSLRSVLK